MEHPIVVSISSQAPEPQGRIELEDLANLADIELTDDELGSMAQSTDLEFLALLGMC